MRITCPHCGERGHQEFTYHGDADVVRPQTATGLPLDGEAFEPWMDYVYWRRNGPMLHREFWYHAGGCRTWLIVTRDVTTHQIAAIEDARELNLTGARGAGQ